MSAADFDADVVIDARDCILGRVSSEVAQRALAGDTIAIVNAERAVITGNETATMETYHTRANLGSDRGPYFPKRPDRIFKRAIRGMLPYKTDDGRTALSNVRVYVGNPYVRNEDVEPIVLDDTSLDRLSNIKFTTLGDISESLGANVTW